MLVALEAIAVVAVGAGVGVGIGVGVGVGVGAAMETTTGAGLTAAGDATVVWGISTYIGELVDPLASGG